MSIFSPKKLYTADQSRCVDSFAIESCGLPGMVLMGRAARAAFELLRSTVQPLDEIQVLCGPGNNGGDGLLLARLAHEQGIAVRVFLVDGEPRSPDARRAADLARASGVLLAPYSDGCLSTSGAVVDAMLGTGIAGDVRQCYLNVIAAANDLGLPTLALDVPTGIDSDRGCVNGAAIVATWTMSFITAKRGLYTGDGPRFAGSVVCDDLEVPQAAYDQVPLPSGLLDLTMLRDCIPKREITAHKGRFGRCVLVGGDRGMGGALMLAAESALRTGAGLAQAATRAEHLMPLLSRSPECMVTAVAHRNDLMPFLTDATSIVVGPGLGTEAWGEQMLHACLASGKRLLLDADALNLLAAQLSRGSKPSLPPGSVITPHPGEAARLLGVSTLAVQADRFAAASELQQRFDAVVVLKGNGSLIVDAAAADVCAAGNPGMASGGMGDVLSGVIGSLLAQGCDAGDAARLGVVLHATAADCAAAKVGQAGLLASDVIKQLAGLLR